MPNRGRPLFVSLGSVNEVKKTKSTLSLKAQGESKSEKLCSRLVDFLLTFNLNKVKLALFLNQFCDS